MKWETRVRMFFQTLAHGNSDNENDNEIEKEGKVFYGQEPPSGESTTTECGFNYELLAVIY